MAHTATRDHRDFPSNESFEALLEESMNNSKSLTGRVVKGRVIGLDKECALVDVGMKSEGRVALREFNDLNGPIELKVGDEIDVYVERLEDRNGDIVLSREKARREEVWEELEKAHNANERVNGTIFSRVKGGFTVDLAGVVAFLPGSQVDVRPIKDPSALMNVMQPFMVLKMDRARGNIVVSRRSILEESRAEARSDFLLGLQEAQVVQGIVKNITDYGAFVDLGGVDGLLHVTDISWRRINHPSDVLHVGDTISVQVIRFNEETKRISLGMKQLEQDPWEAVEDVYQVGSLLKGRVTNITDYGAFVELDAKTGIEGLIHVSEMSWTKKNVHPSKIVSTSEEIQVTVLEVDKTKRRISLGMKQCVTNPWQAFAANHKVGDVLEGDIKNATEFGLFIGLPGDIDGMVHSTDLSWDKSGDAALKEFSKGQHVKVKVLDIDVEKERISLGIKQLSADPYGEVFGNIKSGDVVTCTVSQITDGGIEVMVDGKLKGFIKKADLSKDRAESNPERFAVGEKVDALITALDKKDRRVTLSIKAREIREEKEAMAEYGSSDSGASLGDILGAALKKAKEDNK